MSPQTKRSQTAQLLEELVDGQPIEGFGTSKPANEVRMLRAKLDKTLTKELLLNAQARRLSRVAARNKMFD